MIVSHRWLFRHLPGDRSPQQVVEGLEQLGCEVASVSSWGDHYGGVELVEVVERNPHPDSDHLSLVRVRRGNSAITQIVTGANNGFVGEHLWYAPPGTTLPDGRTLEVRELRGIASPGMLLSAEELGYQAHTGDLWVWNGPEPLGTTFLEAIGGVDTLYELELTPNIAQYLQNVRRLAGELAAIWQVTLNPDVPNFAYGTDPLVSFTDVEHCPLYGVVRLALRPGSESPLWMQTLLRAVGHRIIHPAVDVTNYILWDLGEPLHAFDARRVAGDLAVRRARPDETLTLLDGSVLTLDGEDLVIADRDKVLALAGIMGGIDSGIADDSTEVLLECAHFAPLPVFRSMKIHNVMTDAAQHFGRGTDPEAVFKAPSVVIQVLQEAGILDRVGESQVVGTLGGNRTTGFSAASIRRLLGVEWSDGAINEALTRFGYRIDGDVAVIPRYRHDVESVYDLAEDVARYYGLNAVPRTLPLQKVGLAIRSRSVAWDEEVRDLVASAGYHEVMTRTFVSPAMNRRFTEVVDDAAIVVANPLREEESVMRTGILASLGEVVRYNRSRHDLPIRIFEVGTIFERRGDHVVESRELGVVLSLDPEPALPPTPDPSVYDLTGLTDFIAARLGLDLERGEYPNPPSFLHPARVQQIWQKGQAVGYVGELRPRVAAEYRCRRMAVLVLRVLEAGARLASQPGRPSRFPEVQRDLSLVVPSAVRYGDLRRTIQGLSLKDLCEIRPIDRFVGDFGTSITVRLIFQSDAQTLTDEGVDTSVRRIVSALASLGVELRQ